MRYIINNNIKYHEDKSELISLSDHVEPLQLTATLNRLLSALVRNNNLVLSRETLLMQVWEAHGQVASGNNLNNTISILRKMFASLGEEEIIVTLPRQGFMFTAATLKTADSLAEKLTEAAPAPVAIVAVSPRRNLKRLKSVGLAALFTLAAGSAAWAWQDTGYPPLSAIDVGMIDNCKVQFITTFHKPGFKKTDLDHLRNMIKQRPHIQCNEPATLLYYDTQTLTPNGSGKARVSYFYFCPQSLMAEDEAQCESFYESWGL
ncbi:winged helix-turn-helix domain-containing protein [Serratia entomophila]|uniref:winged helix-turn-helix domain-containing protein n=1 Tax=Serratia entomophila TaxID=42906 RepID=UPI002177D138|nr:winged helix-turn-helix domain-containing protein [Serratia entomophila]CAI0881710.1 phosphate regulon transcriptional regulatory protein PhoB [Serratia entomophila]CAI1012890.1 phosphate regulon transcriptional regulatory protein PhoB [Serratia entomophila]CAI1013570.1 phosphate regulon transcriptional regulatory protein PhoB [Serratia entomophila]CAI1165784.1 phosphate regulon transcriptional regulatory protein PhoB [Serratia entomophila]CAI1729378.1 phosphate regulon transcriptional regu